MKESQRVRLFPLALPPVVHKLDALVFPLFPHRLYVKPPLPLSLWLTALLVATLLLAVSEVGGSSLGMKVLPERRVS